MTRKPDIDAAAAEALLRRVFGTSVALRFERTPDGVSTQVYRVWRGAEVFYLRIAEEPGENLETDAELHQRLRRLGVRVADIVHVDVFDADIGRSTVITTEVPGVSVADIRDPDVAVPVIEAAGADLAVINQIPVSGFGFVRRQGRGWPLRAEYPDYASFAVSFLPRPWPGPLAQLFTSGQLAALEQIVDDERARPDFPAVLSHGDFDVTQVFGAGGRYTGIIDFGEIRGAEPWFDIGHFHLHDRESNPVLLLPALLRGYQRVRRLPDGAQYAIRSSAILLGLRQLCRWLGPPRRYRLDDPAITQRVRRLRELIG